MIVLEDKLIKEAMKLAALFLLHDDRDFESIAGVVGDLRLCPVQYAAGSLLHTCA